MFSCVALNHRKHIITCALDYISITGFSNTAGDTSEEETVYPSWIHSCFSKVRVPRFLVFYVGLCRALFVFFHFVCYSIFGFWLPLSYPQTFLLWTCFRRVWISKRSSQVILQSTCSVWRFICIFLLYLLSRVTGWLIINNHLLFCFVQNSDTLFVFTVG